jgi:hypothetical protein
MNCAARKVYYYQWLNENAGRIRPICVRTADTDQRTALVKARSHRNAAVILARLHVKNNPMSIAFDRPLD